MLEEGVGEPFEGAIECDETMIGGRRHGKRGWSAAGKVIVFGILKRNGRVKVFPVSGRKYGTLLDLIGEHTKPVSTILMTIRLMPLWGCEANMWWCARKVGDPRDETLSMASKASGVIPKIGSIPCAAFPAKTSISIWPKYVGASTIGIKTFIP